MRLFGYEADRATAIPPEAAVVSWAAEEVLRGRSLRSLARQLEGQAVRPVGGGDWLPVSLKRTLVNPRTAGLDKNGEQVAVGILDREQWEQVRDKLTDPARRAGSVRHRYLLSGLARCGVCTAPLQAKPHDGVRAQVCRKGSPTHGCGKIKVSSDRLEEAVRQKFLDAVLVDDEGWDALSFEAQRRALRRHLGAVYVRPTTLRGRAALAHDRVLLAWSLTM